MGPKVKSEALIASAGGTKEGLAKRIATYLLRIARGMGTGEATVTASEQMQAMDLIWRMSVAAKRDPSASNRPVAPGRSLSGGGPGASVFGTIC